MFNFGYCCFVQLGVGMWNVKEFLKIYKVVTRYCVDLSADILNLLAPFQWHTVKTKASVPFSLKQKGFRCQDSNPGLSGESRVS